MAGTKITMNIKKGNGPVSIDSVNIFGVTIGLQYGR
jgi:hypothetical protein